MAPATKATQKRLEAVVTSFNARYSDLSQWGADRWANSLYPALARPTTYCAVINRYAVSEEQGKAVLSASGDGTLQRLEFPTLLNEQVGKELKEDVNHVVCYERTVQNDSTASRSESAVPFPIPHSASALGSPLLTHWNMDAASVLAASMLDVRPGDYVLDMCAAPGGKTVVLAQSLFPQSYAGSASRTLSTAQLDKGQLVVNELDSARCKRLTSNVKSYLPAKLFPTAEHPQAPVKILNKDLSMKTSIALLPHGPASYNKILIDAPCSSERHIIHAYEKAKASGQIAEEMLNWKGSHVSTLVKVQTGLLSTALKALKIGGRLVYATCALGNEENDGVIEKVLDNVKVDRKRAKKNGERMETWSIQFLLGDESLHTNSDIPILQSMSESTKYGRIALPDHGGRGPLYFSVMTKIEKPKKTKTSLRQENEDTQPVETASHGALVGNNEDQEP